MSPGGVWACLALHARRMLRPLAALLAAALAALLLGALGARAAQNLLHSGQFEPLGIAVSSRDDSYDTEAILAALAPAAGLDGAVRFAFTTEEEARRRVATGEAAAGILLPEGFGGSLLTGENLPPTLLVNAARPLERMLVTALARSALGLLTGAQQGITTTLETMASGGDATGSPARDLNIAYALWAVGRLDLFESQTLNPTGALSVSQHYLLCIVLLLALLCAPVLYPAAPSAQNRAWLARMRSGGVPLSLYTVCGALCAWACYFLMLVLLAGGLCLLPGGPGLPALARPAVWLALAACSLFLACFSLACCLLGSPLACTGAACGLSFLMLYLAGGLLPHALLPASAAAVGRWTPFSWMLRALSLLFGVVGDAGPFWALCLCAAALLALVLAGQRILLQKVGGY